ncbi:hypothetical protein [Acuticoccus sp.]|uniref:hypothetical protein n=1 Tax=Acuticoccus sp. TaxID=1904378 RepID=UPI003B51E1A0
MVDHTARVDAVVAAPPFSRISWGSIIAGTLCAFALQLLLNLVGLGLGLAAVDLSEGNIGSFGIGAGIWWGLSAIISLIVGGWIAGRLAGVPIRLTAAIHGASVWALATLLTVWLATTTLSTVVSGAFGAVGQIGQATASAVGGLAGNIDIPNVPALAPGNTAVTEAGQQRQSVMRSIRNEARQLYRQVVSRQEQEAATQAVQSAAADIARSPGDIGQDLNALVDRLFAAGGTFGEEDREQALNVLQQQFNLTDQEAERIVDNWQQRYEAAVAGVDDALEQLQAQAAELREEAAQAAENAAEAVGAAAGWTSLALALGLLAGVIGGILGKPEPWMVEVAEENAV